MTTVNELEEDYDFGFSVMSNEDITTIKELERAKKRVQEMYNLITPLLDNLSKDADKNPIINWPDRGKKIAEFKKKLTKILNDK